MDNERSKEVIRPSHRRVIVGLWIVIVVFTSATLYNDYYADPGMEEEAVYDVSRVECVDLVGHALQPGDYRAAFEDERLPSVPSRCTVSVPVEASLQPVVVWALWAAGLTVVGIGVLWRGSWLGAVVRVPLRSYRFIRADLNLARTRRFGSRVVPAAVVGITLLAFGAFVYDSASDWVGGAGATVATLTSDAHSTGAGPNQSCCVASVKYTVDGQEYQRSSLKVRGDATYAGDETTIYYALDDPSQSGYDDHGEDRWFGVALLFIGGVTTIAAIGMYVAGRVADPKTAW